MIELNRHYAELEDSYLFAGIAQKVAAYAEAHPGERILRLGIGDVSLPLPEAVIAALHEAVDEQANPETFQGYLPECGAPFLRKAIVDHYATRGVFLDAGEVFVSSGASDELGDILDLFDSSSPALVIEPAYPAYVDASVIAGRRIVRLESGKDDGFAPWPDPALEADLIYLCSPSNPTGAHFTRDKLKAWVDFANARGAVILFDAAYEAFILDENVAHSIFEVEGARTCAIEICSLSKTAGFTGTRLGYTVIPFDLKRSGMRLADMWVRNRTTKTNGVSFIVQKGAAAVFTPRRAPSGRAQHRGVQGQRAGHHGDARRGGRVVLRRRERAVRVDGVPARHGQLGVLRLSARERAGGWNPGRRVRPMRRGLFPPLLVRQPR